MKYFILYNDMDRLYEYLKHNDISATDVCPVSNVDTLKFPGIVEDLIKADLRIIMPDFVNNRQCVMIVDDIIEIMGKNNMRTEALVAFFRRHNLIWARKNQF